MDFIHPGGTKLGSFIQRFIDAGRERLQLGCREDGRVPVCLAFPSR